MCAYQDDPSVKKTGVSDADIQTILDEHNKYRSGVSPTAKAMQKMVSYVLDTGKGLNANL